MWRLGIALALAVCADGAIAEERGRPAPLPPEVMAADDFPETDQKMLKRFGSEPLWPASGLGQYSERYRFTYFGILTRSLQVRIDIPWKGRPVLNAIVLVENRVVERKRRQLAPSEFADFRKLVDESGLWKIYPEFWLMDDPEEICLDGMQALVEKRNREGYYFSKGNTSCTSPPGMGLLIEKMTDLAGLESNFRWFPWSKRDR